MKIALVGRFGEGEILSGPERVGRELYCELKSNYEKVIFIEYFFSSYRNSTIIKKIFGKEILNDNVIRFGIFPLIFFLLKEKFDLLHIVNLQRFILSVIPLKIFLSCKIVTNFHGLTKNEIARENYFYKRYFLDILVEKLLVKKSDLLIFPSALLLNQFQKKYLLLENKYKIIPNGVSKNFSQNEGQFPSIEKSIKLVFFNGFDKIINRGLKALIHLLEKVNYEIELFIIGEQVNINHLAKIKMIFQAPMSHNELISFLKGKHFVIKSANFDSFSIFVVECMALGLIPLVSDNVGIKDFIEPSVNGFVYDSNSKVELAELLNQIAAGKYDLSMISASAKKTSGIFNWEKIAEEYIAAYKSIL
ncbi:MAG: glycosyltransferase family 4 protein [Ignavibacteriaceae bacterium]|nr:glycosyltransferase family 4 protein [Ignavibacteriaceae bacterium]